MNQHSFFSISGRILLAVATCCIVPNDAAANELSWEGGITAIYQDTDDSRTDSEFTASADLFGTLTQAKGEWLLYIEASTSPRSNGVSAYYPTANGDASSVLTADGSGGIQISELNYTFFMQQNRTLMLGLIDPSAWLDRGRIANDENKHFLNGSFVNNATIEFPDYTLGGVFRLLGDASRPELTFVVAGSDGIADIPDRSYQDLLDLNADGRGVFVGAGASWLSANWSRRFGVWLRTDDHPVADNTDESETNFGAYGVLGWQSGAHAVNVRAGFSNPDVSIAEAFLAVAYQRSLPLGLLGLGVAYTDISSGYQGSGRGQALDSEIFIRIPILKGKGHVSPSIQYIEAPGIDLEEPMPRPSAVIAGVRVHWFF